MDVSWILVTLLGCRDETPTSTTPTSTGDTAGPPLTELFLPPSDVVADCWSWQVEYYEGSGSLQQRILRVHEPVTLVVTHYEKDRDVDGVMDYFIDFEWDDTYQYQTARIVDDDGNGRVDETTRWVYDAEGHVLELSTDTDGDGARDEVWTYTYENGLRTLGEFDVGNNGSIDTLVTYSYDKVGRPLFVWVDEGNEGGIDDTTTFAYVDETGPDVTVTLDRGTDGLTDQIEVFRYDSLSQLVHYEFTGDADDLAYVTDTEYTPDGDVAGYQRVISQNDVFVQGETWVYTYAAPRRRLSEHGDYTFTADATIPALTVRSDYVWTCP